MIGGNENMEALYSQNQIYTDLLVKRSNNVEFWNSTFIVPNYLCKTTFSLTLRTAVNWQLLTNQITLKSQCTVKLVNNDHPWMQPKVVFVQMFITFTIDLPYFAK